MAAAAWSAGKLELLDAPFLAFFPSAPSNTAAEVVFDNRSAQELLDAELTKERFQELAEELSLYDQFPNEKQE